HRAGPSLEVDRIERRGTRQPVEGAPIETRGDEYGHVVALFIRLALRDANAELPLLQEAVEIVFEVRLQRLERRNIIGGAIVAVEAPGENPGGGIREGSSGGLEPDGVAQKVTRRRAQNLLEWHSEVARVGQRAHVREIDVRVQSTSVHLEAGCQHAHFVLR